MSSAELAAAIVAGRAEVLRKVPGVGQKTAERIVLDLRDKVTPPEGAGYATQEPQRPVDADLIAALTALGYSTAEAADAAARLPENGDRPLEDRIREALALFSS
jgi:Holliday junction DNA helicase RuvA